MCTPYTVHCTVYIVCTVDNIQFTVYVEWLYDESFCNVPWSRIHKPPIVPPSTFFSHPSSSSLLPSSSTSSCIYSKAKGCSTITVVIDSLAQSPFFSPRLYGAVKPKRLAMVLPVIKETMLNRFRTFKMFKDIKIAPVQWYKSHGIFAEWVDFVYWLSCIGKGLGLHIVESFQTLCQEPSRATILGFTVFESNKTV